MNPAQRIRVLADALDAHCSRKQAARVARDIASELDQLIGCDVDAANFPSALGTASRGHAGGEFGTPTTEHLPPGVAPAHPTTPTRARVGVPTTRT